MPKKPFLGLILLVSLTALALEGCRSDYDYPVEPVLKYKNFVLVKNQENQLIKGILVLEFTDGDGDIGLGQEDTLPPYHYGGDAYYNFFIDLYTKADGQYDPVIFPDTNYTFNSRIPEITLNGKSKAIKGEIEYTFDLQIMLPFLQSDTIMIETSIMDRALHQSNQVTSPDIVLK